MPAPVPLPVRAALWQAHRQGSDSACLARRFGLAPRTVRHLLRCARLAGDQPPAPRQRPAPPGPRSPADLVDRALGMRREHPDWGAVLIRVMLQRQGVTDLPQPRTLQRWLAAAGLAPAPPGRRGPHRPRSPAPHQTWQVDAQDQLRLAGGQLVSWLRLTDECSGAFLRTAVFDTVFNRVRAEQARAVLRAAFAAWGLPEWLRLDNGMPWGGWNDLPTVLALDLAGLGLRLHFNDPRSPWQNGVVERSHGVSDGWVEAGRCPSPPELQRRLDEMDQVQREAYPHKGSSSRLAHHPGLRHSGRPYSPEWEEQNWSLQRAKEYLAGHVAERRVSREGRVWLYAQRYHVGRVNARKKALVQYDPDRGEWLFSDERGALWCRHKAEAITQQRIRALDLSDLPEVGGKPGCPD